MHAKQIIQVVSCHAEAEVGETPAFHPLISGQAWITGVPQHVLDPTDPWPQGYRLADTWPRFSPKAKE